MKEKDKLLIIADLSCDTGFATISHNLVEHLHDKWDLYGLGINYYGDYHPIQEKIKLYAPMGRQLGDLYGSTRVLELISLIKPDTLLVINDPWVSVQQYGMLKDVKDVHKILYTPVDALHLKTAFVEPLNDLFDHVIAYTEFGKQELTRAGLSLPISIIPHGVDTSMFYPVDKKEVRKFLNIPQDWFIVNVTDRNAPRKRLDLALYYFAEWIHQYNIPENVKLYYHGALKDEGWDLGDLAEYFGILDRFVATSPKMRAGQGIPVDKMNLIYNMADVGLSTSGAEGWSLTVMERMACKLPMIVPFHSALAEWANGGVCYTSISEIPSFGTKGLNTQQCIPNMQSTVDALNNIYNTPTYRDNVALWGYSLVTQPKFQWKNIAASFHQILSNGERKDGS